MLEHQNNPFNLDLLLDNACSSPESFEEWNRHQLWVHEEIRRAAARDEPVPEEKSYPYKGYMVYTIDTHCTTFYICARRRRNGTYDIKNVVSGPRKD